MNARAFIRQHTCTRSLAETTLQVRKNTAQQVGRIKKEQITSNHVKTKNSTCPRRRPTDGKADANAALKNV
jgi:hypothetical protein